MSGHKTEPPSDRGLSSNGDQARAEIDARALLGERREVTIIHAGERYRLRVTANNKLILTK
ncbi:hemin uptake protein HemP [Methylocystis suflitae]|uniref:hemin uptake protein HemP n=1 Tax=Methylocystis suflitae TaxID=2951405 RepID=UPI00210EF4FB|nr:hemin uptake protein HemP [Methylocystis suflitae]MCQ4189577.1 hemin uptake protein HemP [Methylocystis suflitae]